MQDNHVQGGSIIKKLIGLFVFAMILGVGMASLSYAAGDMAAPSNQTINGELLRIDGEFYLVKDRAGAGSRREIRLHVDKITKLGGDFKVHDKVEAQVTEKDHALSIKHVQPSK
jgi:hypothetical protein